LGHVEEGREKTLRSGSRKNKQALIVVSTRKAGSATQKVVRTVEDVRGQLEPDILVSSAD
jgi:hypothetical protein